MPGLVSAALIVVLTYALVPTSAAQRPTFDRVRVLETPRDITNARLTDQLGREFPLHSLHGKVALVFFGFTNCPDICPLAMERLQQLHGSELVSNDRIAYVMISIDGERDTPAAMKDFLSRYSQEFIGLTAEPQAVKSIAAQFSAMFFKGAEHPQHGGYNVTHSPQIFVLDTQGQLRAEIYSAPIEAMAGIANALLANEL